VVFYKSLAAGYKALRTELGYAARVQNRMLEEKAREVGNMLLPIELHFGKLLESKEHGALKKLRQLAEVEWQLLEATRDSEVLVDSFLVPQVKGLQYDIQERRQVLASLLERDEYEGLEEELIVQSIDAVNRKREELLRQESGDLSETMDRLRTELHRGALAGYFELLEGVEERLGREFDAVQVAVRENKRVEGQVEDV
jgi:hypothetical protein